MPARGKAKAVISAEIKEEAAAAAPAAPAETKPETKPAAKEVPAAKEEAAVEQTEPAPKEESATEKTEPAAAEESATEAEKTEPAPAEESAAEKTEPAPAEESAAEKTEAAPEEQSAAEKTEAAPAEEPAAEKTEAAAAPAEEPAAETTEATPAEEPAAETTEATPAPEEEAAAAKTEPEAPEEQMETSEKTPASLAVVEEGDSDASTSLGRDDTVLTTGSMTEQEATAAVTAEAAPGSLRIKVVCDMTQPGDVVGIVGEDEALGSWDTAKMLTLSTSAADFPTWFVDVPSVAIAKDHKFVVLRADRGVTWEPIDGNRKLDGTSMPSLAKFGSWP